MDVRYIMLGFFAVLIGVLVYFGMNMIRTETVGTITVVINTPEGDPAFGVNVFLKSPDGRVVAQSVTGDDGTAIFVGVALNREYIVEVQSEIGILSEKIFPTKDGEGFVFSLKKAGEGSAEGDRPNL